MLDPILGVIIPNMGSPRSLADALFSRTQQRVLGVLFGRPDQSFFANELVRLAGGGFGAVHRELASLEAAGLVKTTRIGNQKHYQANREAPIFEELRDIVVKTVGAADVLRKALRPLAKAIRVAFIYGSIAKRTDNARSDIDLFVVSDKIAYPDLIEVLLPVEAALGRKISPIVHSPAELARKRKAGESFVTRVLEQPKIFVIGGEDELGQPR